MSKFSGKCDFYDEIVIFGLEWVLNHKIYLGNSEEPLQLNCLKDCIPYYPHIISTSCTQDGKGVIRLSEKSWVDIENERYGHSEMRDIYKRDLENELKNYKENDELLQKVKNLKKQIEDSDLKVVFKEAPDFYSLKLLFNNNFIDKDTKLIISNNLIQEIKNKFDKIKIDENVIYIDKEN